MDELKHAIERTKELFKKRPHASDWSTNLIEGSESITDPKVWTHYYDYIVNPTSFVFPKELEDIAPCKIQKISELPANLTCEAYKNGTEMGC